MLSAIITTGGFVWQLYNGMQNYKRHKLQVYKGKYVDIPDFSSLSKNETISSSLHYPGFLVVYVAWGYTICFHLVLVVFIIVRLVPIDNFYLQVSLTIAIPILVIYFLKTGSISCFSRYFFTNNLTNNDTNEPLERWKIRNQKCYAILLYLTFFAGKPEARNENEAEYFLSGLDCFIGIAACIIRVVKGFLLNVYSMARLDHSFLGRPFEEKGE